MITEEMVRVAASAFHEEMFWNNRTEGQAARKALEAVAPLILEEAAKAVEVLPGMMAASPTHVKATGPKECAAVIRALSPNGGSIPLGNKEDQQDEHPRPAP